MPVGFPQRRLGGSNQENGMGTAMDEIAQGVGEAGMLEILERQKTAQRRDGAPSAEIRVGRIDRAIGLLVDHKDEIADAIGIDFGSRSVHTTLLADVAASISSLRHARSNLRRWMKPLRRGVTPAPLGLLGARARVEFQPKGVVGIVSPWNYPVNLAFSPLAGVLAAGCRAMVKPSEHSPRTSELLARLVRSSFDETEIAVVPGGPEVGAGFARLPFDHLLFTGAASVARHVARAAAENLVPATLELGGKSPVLVGRSADLGLAAARTMLGKTMNAGQTCLAPDFALVPRESVTEFVKSAQAAVAAMYPTLRDNPDYTSVVDRRHHDRLQGYLRDAREKGAKIVEINPAGEDFRGQEHHKIPPTLILDASDGMAVMQEEIFGPLLPVVACDSIDEAIEFVNARPRPLGLYYFGKDKAEERHVLSRTVSGGVTVNDVIQHVAMEDLPFGGIGPSGMGAYHGEEGFRTFSHAKAVFRQSSLDVASVLRPPYGAGFARLLRGMIRR
jgi:coniferyl-aldehyde dehydrogenase